MKLISYSIFGAEKITDDNKFEFMAYLRGLYWNVRMNRLIYPDWKTHITFEKQTAIMFKDFFDGLSELYNYEFEVINKPTYKLCEGMIWRMKPLWRSDVTHLLCRDTDSITTYREAQLVQYWLNDNIPIQGILDNPAHAGLMGGMIGLKEDMLFGRSYEDFIEDFDLTNRGSDQQLINYKLGRFSNKILWERPGQDKQKVFPNLLPGVDPKLWESNLTCRHIGSPGVVEMEMIRFFKRFDNKPEWTEFEKQHPDIFYWYA